MSAPSSPQLVANARMYAVNPSIAAAWAALFDWVASRAGVPLNIIDHAAPAPLETLWQRPDLGLAFICGYPFATGRYPVTPVAVPLPDAPLSDGQPLYASHLVTRADAPITALQDSFGRRLGWTVEHSQSGFNALRAHLLPHWRGQPLYAESIGPLQTPRRVIEALLWNEIDIGPLDSYVHDLLLASEPDTTARLRVVETTALRPMPLLIASSAADPAAVARLREALLAAGTMPEAGPLLARLRLRGFAPVASEDYGQLLDDAQRAESAGYSRPE